MESQKLKTQKLKCYVLGPKSQKFPTAENTRYTVCECRMFLTRNIKDYISNMPHLVYERHKLQK